MRPSSDSRTRLQCGKRLHPRIARLVILGAKNVIGVLLLFVERANEEGVQVGVFACVGGARGLASDGGVGERDLAELGAVLL